MYRRWPSSQPSKQPTSQPSSQQKPSTPSPSVVPSANPTPSTPAPSVAPSVIPTPATPAPPVIPSANPTPSIAPNYVVSTVSGIGGILTVAVDPNTLRVYMAGQGMGYVVNVMDTNGVISAIAGNGADGYANGLGSYATFSNNVWQLYFCSYNGVDIIYIADTWNNLIRAMTTEVLVTTIAGGGGSNAGGSTDAVGTYATFNNPFGVACDSSNGDVWVTDQANYIIRKIAYGTKAVTTVAGQLGIYGEMSLTVSGRMLDSITCITSHTIPAMDASMLRTLPTMSSDKSQPQAKFPHLQAAALPSMASEPWQPLVIPLASHSTQPTEISSSGIITIIASESSTQRRPRSSLWLGMELNGLLATGWGLMLR